MAQILTLVAIVSPAAGAQDAFLARWEKLRTAQPAGVDLHIAAPKAKFYLGEMIPLTLSFTASEARSFTADSRLQDRVGRMNHEEDFVADPVAATEDPLRGLPGEDGGLGGLSGGNAILSSDKPFTVERVLNEWVRFRTPGKYRIYVMSRRVKQVTGTGITDQELQRAGKPIEVVSDVITIEIDAAPREWVAEQIAAADGVLDTTLGDDRKSGEARQRAGLTLRFLDTLESATALAKRLPAVNSVDAFQLHSGILDSHHRMELLPVMEKLLADPKQGISERFLTTLAQLAVLVESGGVMTRYPSDEAGRKTWQAESQRRAALVEERRDHYVSTLVLALGRKEPEPRALTRDALMSVAERSVSQPTWLNGILDALIIDFRALPAQMQSRLLDSRWRLLRGRNVLPLLNDLYANPPQPRPGYPSISELVLRRIYELAPERGRQLILEELHRPDGSRFGPSTLMVLPDASLPELDEGFAAQAARGGPLPGQLITRYATGAIVKNIEAGYLAFNAELDRQKLPHCPFPLVFYFLKFDPDFGERELRNAFTAGRCYDIGRAFDSLGAFAMSPALERLAIDHLNSGIVPIKRGAAEVLGKYGSPASQKPLWDTLEYFRLWWKDREEDLRKPVGQEGFGLERALVAALAQAGGWVLDEAGLRRLLALCSTEGCRQNAREWLQSEGGPKTVELLPYADGRIKVAQYTLLGDRQLRAKLAQFPAGTVFRFTVPRSDDEGLTRASVEVAIQAAGHRIIP